MIDDDFDADSRTYTLTRTYQISGQISDRTMMHVVRIRVARNSYANQSSATADVLTADLTWTRIASAAPAGWWASTPLPGNPSRPPSAESLAPVAAALLARAIAILAAHAAITHGTTATSRRTTTNTDICQRGTCHDAG